MARKKAIKKSKSLKKLFSKKAIVISIVIILIVVIVSLLVNNKDYLDHYLCSEEIQCIDCDVAVNCADIIGTGDAPLDIMYFKMHNQKDAPGRCSATIDISNITHTKKMYVDAGTINPEKSKFFELKFDMLHGESEFTIKPECTYS